MKSCLTFQINKQVPEPLLSSLMKVEGERSFCTVNPAGGIDAYIILDSIQKSETEEIAGNVTVVYQDFDIPFLVLAYKNMSFDMPIFKQEHKLMGNALSIYLLELNGYILKDQRVLGLDENMINSIRSGIESMKQKPNESLLPFVQKIYQKYTPEDMKKGGIRQVFRR